eukprot:COSAG02_NODE_54741_length_294_cov_1.051282_1_plen_67_part_01
MAELERQHPDLIAMHINGCSGDTNPLPRRKEEYRIQYGEEMATAVSTALRSRSLVAIPADAPLRCVA